MNIRNGNSLYIIALAILAGAMMIFAVIGTTNTSIAGASQASEAAMSEVSKAKPSKQFKKRYAKAKRNMNKCRWGKAYRQFLRMRKQAVKFYGYRAFHNLAVTAISAGKKKAAKRWAREGSRAAGVVQDSGGSVNDVMGGRILDIIIGAYVVLCPMY